MVAYLKLLTLPQKLHMSSSCTKKEERIVVFFTTKGSDVRLIFTTLMTSLQLFPLGGMELPIKDVIQLLE